MEKIRYQFIDGLRAYAVLWVMLYHINIFFDLQPITGKFYLLIYMLSYAGHFGVDIFFVISGFLITGLLIKDMEGTIRLKRFYARRFFKIVPQYACAVLIALIISALLPFFQVNYTWWTGMSDEGVMQFSNYFFLSHEKGSLLSYLFFFQNYTKAIPILSHTWSLAVEEHFYLLYPLVLSAVFSWRKEAHQRRSALIGVLIGLILIFNALRYIQFNSPSGASTFATHVRADALMFGCLLKVLEPLMARLPRQRYPFISFVLLSASSVIFFSVIQNPFMTLEAWILTLVYVGAGLLLAGLLLNPFKPVGYFFENKLVCSIGRNSYGLYLWHYILIFPISLLKVPWGNVNAILFYIAASLLFGYASTLTVERFFLNLREKHFSEDNIPKRDTAKS